MEAHFAAETKGCSANLKVASGFENQYRFRLFFSGGIDEGLSGVRGSSGKRDTMNFLFRSGDERGFGRGEKLLCRMSGKQSAKRKSKKEKEGSR